MPARRRFASSRTARRPGSPPRAAAEARIRAGRTTDGFRLSTFGLISPGKGLETAIEALPAIARAASGGRLHDRRPHASRHRAPRGRAVPADARAARARARSRRDTSSSTTASSRSTQLSDLLAATDVFVTPYRSREQISSGALTFAIAAGCARRLDAVLVRAGHARDRRWPPRSLRRLRLRLPMRSATTSSSPSCSRRLARRRGGSVHRSHGLRSPRRLRRCSPRRSRSRRAAGRRGSRNSIWPAFAATIYSRSSTTSGSCSTRTGSSPTATAATASTTSLASRSCRSPRPPRRRADVDADPLSRSRLPARGHRRDRDAQLHELRPALARRAACRRPCRPVGVGARRDPRHGVDSRARRSRARPARTAGRGTRGRGLAAHGRVRGARDSPGSTPTGSIPRRGSCSSASSSSSPTRTSGPRPTDWSWFEDELATTTRGSRRR